jgi:hypothetical protein
MLLSKKLELRRSTIRENLSTLAGKETPDESELRSMTELDTEYRNSEVQYRAALVSEDEERSQAGQELETRSEQQYGDLLGQFQISQVLDKIADGKPLSGATAEVSQEMRQQGSYEGDPIPWEALEMEQRAGETIASGTPDPIKTMGIVDRLFPSSVAAKMGVQSINIPSGAVEWPMTTQAVLSGWQATELGDVGGPQEFQTTDKKLVPDYTFGVQMEVSRRAQMQTGPSLEAAIKRNANATIGAGLDAAVFLGTGATGQPLGIIPGQSSYGIDQNVINAAASYDAFRTAAVEFMVENSATSLSDIRILMRPELINGLDSTFLETGSGITFWDIITRRFGSVVTSSNALAAPSGSPLESTAVLTTTVGGFPPAHLGLWSGLDLVRDPYSLASSGQLKLTFLVTADITVVRPQQVRILTELQ